MLHSPEKSEDSRFTKKSRRRDDSLVIQDSSFLRLSPPLCLPLLRFIHLDKVTGSHDMDAKEDLIPLDDDDIDLLEDDVQFGEIDGIPSVQFSDRVQGLALKSLDLTLVVKSYPSRIIAWIRLPGLPITCYKRSLLESIGSCIGSVVKIDFHSDNGSRGRFARMAIKINLRNPLVSKLVINGKVQLVEYESLPVVCFGCGMYGHVQDLCPKAHSTTPTTTPTVPPESHQTPPRDPYGPWMVVERGSRRPNKHIKQSTPLSTVTGSHSSRFTPIANETDAPLSDSTLIPAPHVASTSTSLPPRATVAVQSDKSTSSIKQSASNRKGHGISLGSSGLPLSPPRIARSGPSRTGHTLCHKGMGGLLDPTKHLAISLPPDANPLLPSSALKSIQRPPQTGADLGPLVKSASPQVIIDILRRPPAPSSHSDSPHSVNSSLPTRHVNDRVVVVASLSELLNSIFEITTQMSLFLLKPVSVVVTPVMIYIPTSDKSCLATFVYASPDYRKRRPLWDYLRDLSLHIQEPWVVLGDFNATLCSMDRRGCANSARPDPDFHNVVIDCGLHDLGSNGPPFTWFKGQCAVRLDRALSNALWLSSFPTASILHLLRMKSDHRPIMLSIQQAPIIPSKRQFRYLAGWSLHSDFQRLLQENWDSTLPISEAIAQFSDVAEAWNSNTYGIIGKQKKVLMARLRGVQRCLSHHHSAKMVKLEAKLQLELDTLLEHEESLWKQKSRSDWIKFGDRNTSFFHSRALSKRRRSRISMLKLSDGEWCSDNTILCENAVQFFTQLFQCAAPPHDVYPIRGFFPPIAPAPSIPIVAECNVAALATPDGWNWPSLQSLLLPQALSHISGIVPPSPSLGRDVCYWKSTPTRIFSIKSAYMQLAQPHWNAPDSRWKFIWSLPIPERLRGFLWLALHNKLLSNVVRLQRHLTTDSACSICSFQDESLLHILRDCPSIHGLWSRLLRYHPQDEFFSYPLDEWLITNLRSHKLCALTKGPWHLFFASILWQCWKRRNDFIFRRILSDVDNLLHLGSHWAILYDSPSAVSASPLLVRWKPPPQHMVCLNTDGAVMRNSGVGSIGDALQAELWAISIGLDLALRLGHTHLLVQCDNYDVVTLLSHPTLPSPHPLVRSILQVLSPSFFVQFVHIYRESNMAADFMAKIDAPMDGSLLSFSTPPSGLSDILSRDILEGIMEGSVGFGVVYGDLSTSPLYVYKNTFEEHIQHSETNEEIYGVLSFVFWSLTLVPLLKYIFIVLKADDNGEGGTFALYSLLCRHALVQRLILIFFKKKIPFIYFTWPAILANEESPLHVKMVK
ncbi:hypothetical protein GQ457_06G016820 [Hibiscus cannabinus]